MLVVRIESIEQIEKSCNSDVITFSCENFTQMLFMLPDNMQLLGEDKKILTRNLYRVKFYYIEDINKSWSDNNLKDIGTFVYDRATKNIVDLNVVRGGIL